MRMLALVVRVSSVTILQEYVPRYRVPFFRELSALASTRGLEIVVEHGRVDGDQALRGDMSDGGEFARREVPIARTRFAGRQLAYRRLSPETIASDLVICEQARRNLELYWLLARKTYAPRPLVALWGHGIDYTVVRTAGERWLQHQLTRRADWFFGYTNTSVHHAIDAGLPSDRATAVMNAIDSAALLAELSGVTEEEVTDFRTRNQIPKRAALFIGGLDYYKRIDLLAAAATRAHSIDPGFVVMVIGEGAERALLDSAIAEGAIIHLGRQFGREKAVALRVATSLAVPGRVGLVAVEALASGLPIVTAAGSLHAPEVEYMTPGVNLLTADATPEAYGRELLAASPIKTATEIPSIERMARNFLSGIEQALLHGGRQRGVEEQPLRSPTRRPK